MTGSAATRVRDEVLDEPPEQIVERAGEVGVERLGRSVSDIAITGVIGYCLTHTGYFQA